MRDSILVLGAGADQLFMIRTAHEMSLKTVAVDGNPHAPGLREATYSEPINFSRIDEVIGYVDRLISQGVDVGGVATMGSDVPHIVGAIADHFGWVGPSEETGTIATDKYAMKVRFQDNGVPVPKFGMVNGPNDIRDLWNEWRCSRLVIKPTDRAGSRGVRMILHPEQVTEAFDYAASYSRNGRIMVEEFVDGPQFSTETIVFEEMCETPGFADRVYEGMEAFHPNIMENGGWVPSLASDNLRSDISDLVERSARSMGIVKGPAKGDVVVCPERGPIMIEMAARLSGGDFCESLVPLGTGINYVKTVIEIAMGRRPDFTNLLSVREKTVANRYFFPPPGRIDEIRNLEECRRMDNVVKLEVNYRPGDRIPAITDHSRRAGLFIVTADNRREAQETIDRVYEKILFKVDGRVYDGSPYHYNRSVDR